MLRSPANAPAAANSSAPPAPPSAPAPPQQAAATSASDGSVVEQNPVVHTYYVFFGHSFVPSGLENRDYNLADGNVVFYCRKGWTTSDEGRLDPSAWPSHILPDIMAGRPHSSQGLVNSVEGVFGCIWDHDAGHSIHVEGQSVYHGLYRIDVHASGTTSVNRVAMAPLLDEAYRRFILTGQYGNYASVLLILKLARANNGGREALLHWVGCRGVIGNNAPTPQSAVAAAPPPQQVVDPNDMALDEA